MPISLDQTIKTNGSTVTSLVTGTWTPAANDLIIVAVSAKTDTVASVSGNGATWTEVIERANPDLDIYVSIWWAKESSYSSGAITVTFDATATGAAVICSRFSGTNGIGATGNSGDDRETTGTTATVNVVTLFDNSWIWGGHSHRNSTTSANQTLISSESGNTGGNEAHLNTEYKTTTTAGLDAVTWSMTTARDWAAGAIEIKEAAAAGGEQKRPAVPAIMAHDHYGGLI